MGWTWSRWGGGHCMKQGCKGELGQGRSRVVRLWDDACVSILSYFPCLSDVFFLQVNQGDRKGLFPSCLTHPLFSFVPSGLVTERFFWRWIWCLQETVNVGLSLFLIRSLQGKTSWPALLSSFVRACLLYLNTLKKSLYLFAYRRHYHNPGQLEIGSKDGSAERECWQLSS